MVASNVTIKYYASPLINGRCIVPPLCPFVGRNLRVLFSFKSHDSLQHLLLPTDVSTRWRTWPHSPAHALHVHVPPILSSTHTQAEVFPQLTPTLITDQGRRVFQSTSQSIAGLLLCSAIDSTDIICGSATYVQYVYVHVSYAWCAHNVGSRYQPVQTLPDSLHMFVDCYEPTSPHGAVKVRTRTFMVYMYMCVC